MTDTIEQAVIKAQASRDYLAQRYQDRLGVMPVRQRNQIAGPTSPDATVTVQIPGHPPGTIPAAGLKQFIADNPGAKQIQ